MFVKLSIKHTATFLNLAFGNRWFFFNLSIALLTYSLGAISYVAYFSLGSLDFDGKPRDKVT